MKIRAILFFGLILLTGYLPAQAFESLSMMSISIVGNQQAKQRLADLETRWNSDTQARDRSAMNSITRDAERWFVRIEQTPQGETRLSYTAAYDDLSLEEKVRLHRMLEGVYTALRREPESEAHAFKAQSLKWLLSLNNRWEEWREPLREYYREVDKRRGQWIVPDEQLVEQTRQGAETIIQDAEKWFVKPSQTPAQSIDYTDAYNQLTVAERILLHNTLISAYSALYENESLRLEIRRRQQGAEDGEQSSQQQKVEQLKSRLVALEQARRQLGSEAPAKTVQEIVTLCQQGRHAEAMFYIEQYDRRIQRNRKLIVNPNDPLQIQEIAREMRALSKSRDSEAYLEQLRLRRCLAQIYVAEDNTEQAVAQFRLILALDPRYSVRQDDTLPATRKVVSTFESAQPKSNTTLPILAALGGLGVLIGSQSGGTVTGLGSSLSIVREAVQSSDPNFVEERLRIIYRDTLGNIARSDSITEGVITIENAGANYEILLVAERGTLSDVKQGRIEKIEANYKISEGEAVIRVRIRVPSPFWGDEIVLPPERFIFQATAETQGLGAPAQISFVVTFPQSRKAALRIQQGDQSVRVPFIKQATSRSYGALRYRLVPEGHSSYQMTIETEADGTVEIRSDMPTTLQHSGMVLTDLTTNQVKLLHMEPGYQFFLRAGERRTFRVTLEPPARSRMVITGLQTSASRSGNNVAIVTTLNQSAQLRLSIQDARGRVLHTSTRAATRGTNHITLTAPELRTAPPGTYLLTLEAQNKDGSVARRSAPLVITR